MPEGTPLHRPPPARYALADAAADLAAAGRLRDALAVDGRVLVRVAPDRLPGGFHGAILDSRRAEPGRLFVGLAGRRLDGGLFAPAALSAGASVLVAAASAAAAGLAAGEPVAGDAAQGAVALLCDDALAGLDRLAGCWRRRLPALVCGITGSNGKTTTKDLLAAILGAAGPVHATAGNLNSAQGVPLTLLGLTAGHRYAVIEMGATACGHIAARAALAGPRLGIITNAAAAHLEEFGGLDRIIEGKGELVAALPPDGVAVLNADSPGWERWLRLASCRTVSWGSRQGDHRWDWRPDASGRRGVLLLDGERWDVPLPGRHNGANLCAAILAARAAGLDDRTIRAGLAAFRASPHRAALRRLGGRLVVDDCYNANPEGMRSAARMLVALDGGPAYAVLGGMAELGAGSRDLHLAVGRDLAALPIACLLAVGDGAAPLAEAFAAAGKPALLCCDQAEAAAELAGRTAVGDRILVKGSRSTAMEKVIESLVADHGWTEEGP